jgi:hypothetical protein
MRAKNNQRRIFSGRSSLLMAGLITTSVVALYEQLNRVSVIVLSVCALGAVVHGIVNLFVGEEDHDRSVVELPAAEFLIRARLIRSLLENADLRKSSKTKDPMALADEFLQNLRDKSYLRSNAVMNEAVALLALRSDLQKSAIARNDFRERWDQLVAVLNEMQSE